MKIGIISDTHGSEARWSLAYDKYLKKADLIVHGQILFHLFHRFWHTDLLLP